MLYRFALIMLLKVLICCTGINFLCDPFSSMFWRAEYLSYLVRGSTGIHEVYKLLLCVCRQIVLLHRLVKLLFISVSVNWWSSTATATSCGTVLTSGVPRRWGTVSTCRVPHRCQSFDQPRSSSLKWHCCQTVSSSQPSFSHTVQNASCLCSFRLL